MPLTTLKNPDNTLPTSQPSNRRQFIQLLGGGAVVAASGSLLGCSSHFPAAAIEPWNKAVNEKEPRHFMLAHGLLAPNPHNRQPWIADLREANHIHFLCDGERLLPETDPFGRQILIGCGAFLELACIAAAQLGFATKVELFPAGEPANNVLPAGAKIATISLLGSQSGMAEPLYQQIVHRHTRKTSYAPNKAIPPELVTVWIKSITDFGLIGNFISEENKIAKIRQIARDAYEIECVTPRTWLESAHLMRIGPDAILAHRDGISINKPLLRILHTTGLFDPLEVPVKGTPAYDNVMNYWAPFETGSGFLWLATPGNSRTQQVISGRAYVRLHLQATAAGVDMHPLSQALQEFAEMQILRQALHQELGLSTNTHTLQMLARVGYSTEKTGPSPRRAMHSLLVT